jgi:hypothetical protein
LAVLAVLAQQILYAQDHRSLMAVAVVAEIQMQVLLAVLAVLAVVVLVD